MLTDGLTFWHINACSNIQNVLFENILRGRWAWVVKRSVDDHLGNKERRLGSIRDSVIFLENVRLEHWDQKLALKTWLLSNL